MVEESIRILCEVEFLVLTGAGSRVFFAKDPLLAHTLGISLIRPDIFDIDKTYFGDNAKQLRLRLVGPNDPESRPRIG